MANVSNPATLSSVQTVFGGTGKLSDYNRGGPYVPSGASSTISTTDAGLALSQFNGVSNVVAVTASVSPTTLSKSSTTRGTPLIQTSAALTATGGGGNGTYTYAWSVTSSSNMSSVSLGTPSASTTTVSGSVTTLTDDGTTVSGSGTVNVKCTITSGGVSASATAVVTFSQSYASCVAYDSWMLDGRQAGQLDADDIILITDPFNSLFNTTRARVLDAWTATVPGVRIITAMGAVLDCSTTAPIPVQEGGYVVAPDLYGRYIPTARPEDITERHAQFLWDKVIEVIPIGDLKVRGLFLLDRCFWASKDGKRFILHHNAKQIAIP